MRPISGVRYAVERVPGDESAPSVRYRGHAHLPTEDIALEITVELPACTTHAEGPPELAREIAALVKSAVKAAVSSNRPPPRRIVRWRENREG